MKDSNETLEDFFDLLKYQFRDHLDSIIGTTEPAFRNYVEEQIKKLREDSSWNILVIFWLGIIDLRSFVFVHLAQQFLLVKPKEKEQEEIDLLDDG